MKKAAKTISIPSGMPGTGAMKYERLSRWNERSTAATKNLLEDDDLIKDETRSPVIKVRLCFPCQIKLEHHHSHHPPTRLHKSAGSTYSKASVWRRILRKLRAKARKVHLACVEGMCFPREITEYNSFTYRKNFDDGVRQQFSSTAEGLTSCFITPLPSSAAPEFEQAWRRTGRSRYDDVREQVRVEVRVDPLWQRRNAISPTKLRVKKVSFADGI